MKKKQKKLLVALVVNALPALETYYELLRDGGPFGGAATQNALYNTAIARNKVKEVTGLDPYIPEQREQLIKLICD